jgi:hypothetical protein
MRREERYMVLRQRLLNVLKYMHDGTFFVLSSRYTSFLCFLLVLLLARTQPGGGAMDLINIHHI